MDKKTTILLGLGGAALIGGIIYYFRAKKLQTDVISALKIDLQNAGIQLPTQTLVSGTQTPIRPRPPIPPTPRPRPPFSRPTSSQNPTTTTTGSEQPRDYDNLPPITYGGRDTFGGYGVMYDSPTGTGYGGGVIYNTLTGYGGTGYGGGVIYNTLTGYGETGYGGGVIYNTLTGTGYGGGVIYNTLTSETPIETNETTAEYGGGVIYNTAEPCKEPTSGADWVVSGNQCLGN